MPEEKLLLDEIKAIIMGLTELDQDAAVLEAFFNKGAKDRTLGRIDESVGALMKLRERVNQLNAESYVKK